MSMPSGILAIEGIPVMAGRLWDVFEVGIVMFIAIDSIKMRLARC